MQLILASQSPRRKELLALITQNFTVQVAAIEESAPSNMSAKEAAKYLALQKARAVFESNPRDIVIGSDTVVEISGELLGKPKDKSDAKRMLEMLSGKQHFVHTGVCIFAPASEKSLASCFVQSTAVTFAKLAEEEIEAYINSKDPFDKAGAYGVQSGAAKFVSKINGCYYNVMGLPVSALYAELKKICPKLL